MIGRLLASLVGLGLLAVGVLASLDFSARLQETGIGFLAAQFSLLIAVAAFGFAAMLLMMADTATEIAKIRRRIDTIETQARLHTGDERP